MNTLETHLLTRLNDELSLAMTIGRVPTRIYLGISEHNELEDIASQFQIDLKSFYGGVLTWNGMGIFRVDTPSHIGFGFSPDSPCS